MKRTGYVKRAAWCLIALAATRVLVSAAGAAETSQSLNIVNSSGHYKSLNNSTLTPYSGPTTTWSPGALPWSANVSGGGTVTGTNLVNGNTGTLTIGGASNTSYGSGSSFGLTGSLTVNGHGRISGTNSVSNSATISGSASVSGSLTANSASVSGSAGLAANATITTTNGLSVTGAASGDNNVKLSSTSGSLVVNANSGGVLEIVSTDVFSGQDSVSVKADDGTLKINDMSTSGIVSGGGSVLISAGTAADTGDVQLGAVKNVSAKTTVEIKADNGDITSGAVTNGVTTTNGDIVISAGSGTDTGSVQLGAIGTAATEGLVSGGAVTVKTENAGSGITLGDIKLAKSQSGKDVSITGIHNGTANNVAVGNISEINSAKDVTISYANTKDIGEVNAVGGVTVSHAETGEIGDISAGGAVLFSYSETGPVGDITTPGNIGYDHTKINGDVGDLHSAAGDIKFTDSEVRGDVSSLKTDHGSIDVIRTEIYGSITDVIDATNDYVNIEDSLITGDVKKVSATGGDVTIDGTEIRGSITDGVAVTGGSATVVDSTILGDVKNVSVSGGDATIDSTEIRGDITDGVAVTGGSATVVDSTIHGDVKNVSASGGDVTIDGTEIKGNITDGIAVVGGGFNIINGSDIGGDMNAGDAIGAITAEDDSKIDNSTIHGDITSITLDTGSLGITGGSLIDGDIKALDIKNGNLVVDGSHVDAIASNGTHGKVEGSVTINDSNVGDNGSVYIKNTSDITLTESTVAGAGEIITSGMTGTGPTKIHIENSIVNIDVRSTAGRNFEWTLDGRHPSLAGIKTDVTGTLEMRGGNDVVTIDNYGDYALLDNTDGNLKVTVNGGHTETIKNNSTDSGNGEYILDAHKNTSTDYNLVQVVENIEGFQDTETGSDVLTVKTGVRYAEYDDILTNKMTNPDRDANGSPQNAHLTSVTNMNQVRLEDGATLEIGTRDGLFGVNDDAEFQTKTLTMGTGSNLFLHEGDNGHLIGSATVTDGSTLWIDRATVSYAGGSQIEVDLGGLIAGYSADPANEANIVGSLTLKAGSTITPYSLPHYDPAFLESNNTPILKYGQTANATGEGFVVNGDTTINGGATFQSRLFDTSATHAASVEGTNGVHFLNKVSDADYIKNTGGDVVFKGMATFDPRFGNDDELGAKQQFKIYEGTGAPEDEVNTYYYSVVRSDTDIVGYTKDPNTGILDAGVKIPDNTLFDNQIVKSDMLGTWDFVVDSTGKEVLLRFRLLAKHPTQGGIAIDMTEPNAYEAAKQIDRIRYPITKQQEDDGYRYHGDLVDEYESKKLDPNNPYPNYKLEYMEDFKDLLLNIQSVIATGANTNEAIRRLHPEPYADLANVNFSIMDGFRSVREQHGVSSLFMVESALKEDAFARAEGASATALASLDDCGVSPFVRNPVRFWASGFGADGKQKKKGTEYGYDNEIWGGAVGMMKEWGDLYGGLSIGYARGTNTWKELTASAKTDAYIADAVIGWRRGMGFVEAFGSYAYSDHTTERDLTFAGYNRNARGEYHDNVWAAGVRVGYQMLCNDWLFVPSIGVNYTQSKSSSFTEKGAYQYTSVLLDFEKGGISRRNVRVPIMGRLSRSFAIAGHVVTPEVRAAVIPQLGSKRASATTRFVGDPSADGRFKAVGIENGRWAGQLGGSLEISRRGRMNVTANYDYTFAKKSHEHSYSLMMGMNF